MSATENQRSWLDQVMLHVPLATAQPREYFGDFVDIPLDESCDQESTRYFLYLRYQAWFGQRNINDMRRDPRVLAAVNWTRLLLNYQAPATFITDISRSDSRFYDETGEIKSQHGWAGPTTSADPQVIWKNALPYCDARHLTPHELELALVMFDWWHHAPRFASWLQFHPETAREIEIRLRKQYCWPLLHVMRVARRKDSLRTNASAPGNLNTTTAEGMTQDFTKFTARHWIPWRLWGVIVVGFLSTFAIDALQHLIWYGPWVVSIPMGLLAAACSGTLVLVDVKKQHEDRITSAIAARRTLRLWFTLWAFAFIFALAATFVLFMPWPEPVFEWLGSNSACLYNDKHPVPRLTQATSSYVPQWLVASFTLGSLSALLGTIVQWLWEDKSAIEPI